MKTFSFFLLITVLSIGFTACHEDTSIESPKKDFNDSKVQSRSLDCSPSPNCNNSVSIGTPSIPGTNYQIVVGFNDMFECEYVWNGTGAQFHYIDVPSGATSMSIAAVASQACTIAVTFESNSGGGCNETITLNLAVPDNLIQERNVTCFGAGPCD